MQQWKSTDEAASTFVDEDSTKFEPAKDVYIYMHRNFRASRNVRAHWLLDHLHRAVEVPRADLIIGEKTDKYGREMEVVGIVPEGGSATSNYEGQKFRITTSSNIIYISRYYRHAFVLDLSPSMMVTDDRASGCLYMKLLETLKMTLLAITRSFKVPGTNRIITPQIYLSITIFTPFLAFDQDMCLVQGAFMTETNVDDILASVHAKFWDILKALREFSQPIFAQWGYRRRKNRVKYDSVHEARERKISETGEELDKSKMLLRSLFYMPKKQTNPRLPKVIDFDGDEETPPMDGVVTYRRQVWKTIIEVQQCEERCMAICEGFIQPEWALIFMIRLGLISVQMLPENTQSNVVVLTDGVCGMPDAIALDRLLSQLRCFTVSCSFVEVHGGAFSEPAFGHVGSPELFNFLSVATFGSYLPMCRCRIGNITFDDIRPPPPTPPKTPQPVSSREFRTDSSETRSSRVNSGSIGRRASEEIPPGISAGANPCPINEFHETLILWRFEKAFVENHHFNKMAERINPEFAEMSTDKKCVVNQTYVNLVYNATLNELLYIRLREGFSIKAVHVTDNETRLTVHLSLAIRPLVFVDYIMRGSFRGSGQRERIDVSIVVVAPESALSDVCSETGDFAEIGRQKGDRVFRNTIDGILEADRLLQHLHTFNTNPAFYHIPLSLTKHASLFRMVRPRRMAVNIPDFEENIDVFIDFWRFLCNLDEAIWQKWVHTHIERLMLHLDEIPRDMLREGKNFDIKCDVAMGVLYDYLKDLATFCLLKDTVFVKFIFDEGEDVPRFFYIIRVCSEPPGVTLKLAFLGGISSSERRQIAIEFRRGLINLRQNVKTLDRDFEYREALIVVRRPMERIHIMYNTVPLEWKFIVRLKNEVNFGEEIPHLIMHNALAKYLIARRRIWNLPPAFESQSRVRNCTREFATYVSNLILERRVCDGFNISYAVNGMVVMCKQVVGHSGFAMEQYVHFPAQALSLICTLNRHRLPTAEPPPEVVPKKRTFITNTLRKKAPVIEYHFGDAHGTDEYELRDYIASHRRQPVYQIVVEVWREPSSDLTTRYDTSTNDEDIVSSLYTLDQLLRRCDIKNSEGEIDKTNHIIKVVKYAANPSVELSGSISIAAQPFSLIDLIVNSERRLLFLPLFDNDLEEPCIERLKLLLNAIHREMQEATDCYLTIEDSYMYTTLLNNDAPIKGTRHCRLYLHRLHSWGLVSILVPLTTEAMEEHKGLPILVTLSDEPSIAYRLARNKPQPKLVVEDLRNKETLLPNAAIKENIWRPPLEYICPTRCSSLQKCAYKPVSLTSYVAKLRNDVCGRAILISMYRAIIQDMEVPGSTVEYVIENFCDHMKLDIQRMPEALIKFCSHFDKCHIRESDEEQRPVLGLIGKHICGSPDFDENFSDAINRNFKQIKSSPLYFIYKRRGRDRKQTTQSERSPLPFAGVDVMSGEKTPPGGDSDSSSDRAPSSLRKRVRNLLYGNDVPLFINFCCNLKWPDNKSTTFFIKSLPYCVNDLLLQLSKNKTHLPYSIFEAKISIEMCVYSWLLSEEDEHVLSRFSTSDDIERTYSKHRMQAFRDSLEPKEQDVIKRLLRNLQRMIELEVVLLESRRQSVSLQRLQRISDFISKEFKDTGADKRLDQKQRALRFALNSPGAAEKLRTRVNGVAVENSILRRFEESDMFICVVNEEPTTQDRRLRMESRRSSTISLAQARSRQVSGEQSSSTTGPPGAPSPPDTTTMSASSSAAPLRERPNSSHHSLPALDSSSSAHQQTPTSAACRQREKSDGVADFWLILTITDKVMLLQLCRRNADRHERLFELVWRRVKQVWLTVNQEMLLEKSFNTRKIDKLLIPVTEPERFVSGARPVSDEEDRMCDEPSQGIGPLQVHFDNGQFSCEMVHEHWFAIHPQVRAIRVVNMSGHPGARRIHSGLDAIKRELSNSKVTNRDMPNVYLVKDAGDVYYMQLHATKQSILAIRNISKTWKKNACRNVENQNFVLLALYGIKRPRPEFLQCLIDLLEKRLHSTTLEHIIESVARVPKLEMDDVRFIQAEASDPSAVFHFLIPDAFIAYLPAALVYAQQQLETLEFQPARYKGESGRRGFTSFLTYPPPDGNIPEEYEPRFYLQLRPMWKGNRAAGIACLESRFVNAYKNIIIPDLISNHRSQHEIFMMPDEPLDSRIERYREMTDAKYVEEPLSHPDGVFMQFVIWQAGDVGLDDLRCRLLGLTRIALCDVITEMGLLNDAIIEAAFASASPNSSATPFAQSAGGSLFRGAHLKDQQQQQQTARMPRAHSSAGALALHAAASPAAGIPSGSARPTLQTIGQRQTAHFNFETRSESASSEQTDKQNGTEEFISEDFIICAEDWWRFVLSDIGFSSPCLLKIELELDSAETPKRVLSYLQNELQQTLRFTGADFRDRIAFSLRRLNDGRYELHRGRAFPDPVLNDFGYELTEQSPPELLMIGYHKELVEDIQIASAHPYNRAPSMVEDSVNNVRDMYPCRLPTASDTDPEGSEHKGQPFVPRQRILYGIFRLNKLTFFLYNFKPDLGKQISNLVTQHCHWFNARNRLTREMSMHKTGIQHMSDLKRNTDSPHYANLWRQPEDVLKDFVPYVDSEREEQTKRSKLASQRSVLEAAYSAQLSRIFRHAAAPFLVRDQSQCFWEDQFNQFKQLRAELWPRLMIDYLARTAHRRFSENNFSLKEEELLNLTESTRHCHFVLTPILLFREWRKRVALIRANGPEPITVESDDEPEKPLPKVLSQRSFGIGERKTSGMSLAAAAAEDHAALIRNRSFTVSLQASNSKDELETLALQKDLSEPWMVEGLFQLMAEYVDFMKKTHGVAMINVTHLCQSSQQRRAYKLVYDAKCTVPPNVWLAKSLPGGMILLHLHFQNPYFVLDMHKWEAAPLSFNAELNVPREVRNRSRDVSSTLTSILTGCHLHSFTYDFHLRVLANFLGGRKSFIPSGYDTNTFLSNFLQYYSCRPSYAMNCVYEERITPKLRHGVTGRHVWNTLVADHVKYGWKALRLKKTLNEGYQETDYILISASTVPSYSEDSLSVRGIVYDLEGAKRRRESLAAIVYMIQIVPRDECPTPAYASKKTSPSHFSRPPLTPTTSAAPFPRIDVLADEKVVVVAERVQSPPHAVQKEPEESFDIRRRFSSGGVLIGTPPIDIPVVPRMANDTDSYVEPKLSMFPPTPATPMSPELHRPEEPAPSEGSQSDSDLTPTEAAESDISESDCGSIELAEEAQVFCQELEAENEDSDSEEAAKPEVVDPEFPEGVQEEDGKVTEINKVPLRRHRKRRKRDIPTEKFAFYVTFVSEKQKHLQESIENAMKELKEFVMVGVRESEKKCRIVRLWDNIVQLPPRSGLQQKAAIDRLLDMTKNWNVDNPWPPMNYALHDTAGPADLDMMLSLVESVRLDEREPFLARLLKRANHARLCRFLLCRYGPQQCKMFSYTNSYKKSIVIINPNYTSQMFLVTFNAIGQTPTVHVLLKEGYETMSESDLKAKYIDEAVCEFSRVCVAFIFSDCHVDRFKYL